MVKAEDAFKCQEIAGKGSDNITQLNNCILESTWDKAASTCAGATTKESCDSKTSLVSSIDADMKCDYSEFRFEKDPKSGGYSTLKVPKLESIGRVFGKLFRGIGKGIEKGIEKVSEGVKTIASDISGNEIAQSEPKEEGETHTEKAIPSKNVCSLKTVNSHEKVILAPTIWYKQSQQPMNVANIKKRLSIP